MLNGKDRQVRVSRAAKMIAQDPKITIAQALTSVGYSPITAKIDQNIRGAVADKLELAYSKYKLDEEWFASGVQEAGGAKDSRGRPDHFSRLAARKLWAQTKKLTSQNEGKAIQVDRGVFIIPQTVDVKQWEAMAREIVDIQSSDADISKQSNQSIQSIAQSNDSIGDSHGDGVGGVPPPHTEKCQHITAPNNSVDIANENSDPIEKKDADIA